MLYSIKESIRGRYLVGRFLPSINSLVPTLSNYLADFSIEIYNDCNATFLLLSHSKSLIV